VTRAVALAALLAPAIARADDPPPDPTPAPEPAPEATAAPAPASVPGTKELAERVEQVEDDSAELARKVRILEAQNKAMKEELGSMRWLGRFITVWVDAGAFAVGGDGSGIRSDIGHIYFPKYIDRLAAQWVFMGDPLSTTINSLGEPADTSDSREIRTDTVHSGGRPSLIVNSVGLSIGKEVGHGFAVAALAELLPRPDHDLLDIELANVQYRPIEGTDLVISAGKVDSVLGVEYRSQDAPHRLGITPSLICRYTCGRPLGINARLVRDALSLSAALTNGDNFDRRFEHEDELKANRLPTAAAHVQWTLPVGQGLELGISGAVGPQDATSARGLVQWHLGFDLRLADFHGFDVTAEYVQGIQPGRTMSITPCDVAPCLSYKGAYVLVDRVVNKWLTPYVRVDWRDAVHQNGVEFVYESHTLRNTIGVHANVTSRIIGKLEYTFNRELGGIPQFADDILTTSIVVATD